MIKNKFITKDEFQSAFRKMIDVVDVPFTEISEKFGVSFPTVSKWYKGVSAPAQAIREVVIEELYERKKKIEKENEITNVVHKYLTENLKLDVDHAYADYAGASDYHVIKLTLGEDLIAEHFINVSTCKCE